VQLAPGLSARRQYDLAGWLGQAQQFYNGALTDTDILNRLAAFGVTPAALEAGRLAIYHAPSARYDVHDDCLGGSMQSTMAAMSTMTQ